jgi:glycosyltransferase involved in cell wall biosynthesis
MNEPDALNPLVSVIVTTRNEEWNISNCLQSIQLQTYKPIEIIVVDNNSTDKTKEIAKSFTQVVVDKGPERSAQRNYGICDLATGEYAMFIDADMILTPCLVAACINEIQLEGVIALHIDEVVLGRGLLAKVRRFERSFYSGTVVDGVRFFNRTDFCEIGGFDQSLPPGPEDWDLDMRIRQLGNIRLLSNASERYSWKMTEFVESRGIESVNRFNGIYHNEDEQSLVTYLKKKIYYAPSMEAYANKWSENRKVVRKQLGLKYRAIVVFTENGKYKRIVRNPVLFALTILLKAVVASVYFAVLVRGKFRSKKFESFIE